jgi:NAD(P)-dependent dehydrogenase (short-subunit alcohol dehydrogenase family)
MRAAGGGRRDAGGGRLVAISMNEATMVRAGFVPYGPAGAGVEAVARVMAADLAGSTLTVNILLPGGATATGMVPDDFPDTGAGPSARPEFDDWLARRR